MSISEQDYAEILARRAAKKGSRPVRPISFTVPGVPVAKPRQTRSDKWKKRPCVLRYREWADKARQAMYDATGTVSMIGGQLDVIAYFPTRSGWRSPGSVHKLKPDADNILKAVSDAICRNEDQMIHDMSVKKRWDDGNGPRVEITIL